MKEKNAKNQCVELISDGLFGKYLRIKILVLNFLIKQKLRGSYAYVEESFDTFCNIGYGSVKSPMG